MLGEAYTPIGNDGVYDQTESVVRLAMQKAYS